MAVGDKTLREALVKALLLAVREKVLTLKRAGQVLERWDERAGV